MQVAFMVLTVSLASWEDVDNEVWVRGGVGAIMFEGRLSDITLPRMALERGNGQASEFQSLHMQFVLGGDGLGAALRGVEKRRQCYSVQGSPRWSGGGGGGRRGGGLQTTRTGRITCICTWAS
jgi:hypothetical protein